MLALQEEAEKMLQKGALEVVDQLLQPPFLVEKVYSHLSWWRRCTDAFPSGEGVQLPFLVEKATGSWRPVIDLSAPVGSWR